LQFSLQADSPETFGYNLILERAWNIKVRLVYY